MDRNLLRFLFVASCFVYCNGFDPTGFEPTNYDLSRKKVAFEPTSFEPTNYDLSRKKVGFGLKEIAQFFLGGGNYGHYPQGPGYYPDNNYYPSGSGHYPGGSGHYPGGSGHYPGPIGPPGAHPGCPLCDSSVYSYCYDKQAHDSCCCDGAGAFNLFGCRRVDCRKLYANSCDEYNLISECCCVDVQKKANVVGPIPVPVLAPVGPVGPVVAVAIKK